MVYVIGICDDLPDERNRLAQMVQTYCDEKNIRVDLRLFATGDELISAFRAGEYHILFLDIYMPGITGMETAQMIRKTDTTCALVFATTSVDHGLESFGVSASDYLVKPIRQPAVSDALDWCFRHVMKAYQVLPIKTDKGEIELPVRDIHYIEIRSHIAWFFTEQGVFTTRRTMDELEKAIDSRDFLRCHRSFLLNMEYVKLAEKRAFLLRTGEEVPIGSTNVQQAKDRWLDWSFARAWSRQ